MATKSSDSAGEARRMRPALTPEAREGQLISLAVDLAEEQLRNGTASSQIITHYLKLGSTREKLEQEILAEQAKLYSAKASVLEKSASDDEKFARAMEAFGHYAGRTIIDSEGHQID